MRFDQRTIQVLQNFANINKSIRFIPGKVIYTASAPSPHVVARASIANQIEREFAIGDLSRFLGVLRLFRDPVVEINRDTLTLTENDKVVEYVFAEPNMLAMPPTKEIAFPVDVHFKLPARALKEIKDGAAALGHREVVLVGDSGGLFLETRNIDNPTSDKFRIRVGETEHGFCLVIRIDNLYMLADDYEVEASFRKIVRFYNKDLEYYVAVEAHGTIVP